MAYGTIEQAQLGDLGVAPAAAKAGVGGYTYAEKVHIAILYRHAHRLCTEFFYGIDKCAETPGAKVTSKPKPY